MDPSSLCGHSQVLVLQKHPQVVYAILETQRGLELQSQGGARARVKQVELIDLSIAPAAGRAFTAVVGWNVAGSVGHWGHIHERRNRYRAELDVAPVEGVWKLVRVTILEEERI